MTRPIARDEAGGLLFDRQGGGKRRTVRRCFLLSDHEAGRMIGTWGAA